MNELGWKIRSILTSRWFPWTVAGVILVIALLHEIVHPAWFSALSRGAQAAVWALALAGFLLAYLAATRLLDLFEGRERLEQRLVEAERLVAEAYQRLEAIFQVSQKFVDASDENEVIAPILGLLIDVVAVEGVSFVPLDEHGQPQALLSRGDLPFPAMDTWLEYLASPGVRERCEGCEKLDELGRPADCPLLSGPFSDSTALLCLPVRRSEHEFGMVTLFLAEEGLDRRARAYLRALVDEMALGLDGVRFRRRELEALRQVQVLRRKTDLEALLSGLLENVYHTLGADCAVMLVRQPGEARAGIDIELGDLPPQARSFIDGILQGVMASEEPVLLGDVSGDPASTPGLRSLLAAPLCPSEREVLGAILAGRRRGRSFSQRELALLQTVAGQVALVVQNANLMAELEYKTMIQERTRLAREIHDGLAQTLGFLKLQAAQMRSHFARGEVERVRQAVDLCYDVLSEAYQDARQAIDGLRISLDGYGIADWLEQMVGEFEELSGLPVELVVEQHMQLPPEYHAQLVRMLQEALSNVRKHARANQVWVVCREIDGDLVLEIRDDGMGFSPEYVVGASRHGLRGMRERAELIGADFQVISRPQEGTTVRVRLPLKGIEEVVR